MRFRHTILAILLTLSLLACRENEYAQSITPSTQTAVTDGDPTAEHAGFYLLNEANMGSNKASLDYFDYTTGIYHKNIYAERNPLIVGELGDVGNDVQIYDGMLFAVINCSNLVEVMDAQTAKHIATISIPSCRYITFADGYAYVTSWAGELQSDMSRKGYVAKIDLATFEVVDKCAVGFDPEKMAVYDGKLYVANSGGNVSNYDNTVSIIDLATFSVVDTFLVAINLHHLEIDDNGVLWVSSRGNYIDIESKIIALNASTGAWIKSFDVSCTNMTLSQGKLYVIYSPLIPTSTAPDSFAKIDTVTMTIEDDNFIKDGSSSKFTLPYGVAVNSASGEIFITDATDFITPGKIYCYTPDGVLKWSATTGDAPAHITFLKK